jgi:hypothetical protein
MAGRKISRKERRGVPATDMSARSPLGVGVSITPQGNTRALGRSERQRRYDREDAGISPPHPIHPDSPRLIPGDQGG